MRKAEDGESLRAEASDRLRPVILDVTDVASIQRAAEEVGDAVGAEGLAGVVNNAGVAVPGPLEVVPLDEFRRQIEVNLTGQLAVTREFLPLVREATGRIVLVTSVGGRIAFPFNGPYHASKFGLEAVGECLRQELRPWGIEVSIVEPGSIATPIWEKGDDYGDHLLDGLSEEGRHLYGERLQRFRQAMRETGERGIAPSEVAKVIEHALTARRPKTRYLVGRDAKVQARLRRLIPDRAFDRLVARTMATADRLDE